MKILLATKDPSLRISLELALSDEPSVTLVGTASEGHGLSALIESSQPNIVIVDWDLPGRSPAKIMAQSHRLFADVRFMVLGTSPVNKDQALAAGADAYVVMGDSPDQLLTAFRRLRKQSKSISVAETNDNDDA